MDQEIIKLMSGINAQYQKRRGKDPELQFDVIQRLSKDYDQRITTWQSGSLTLDLATGRNGIPKGRVIEIYGPESSGKTTTAMLIIASIQRQEALRAQTEPGYVAKTIAFIDAEHAFDPMLAIEYGVDIDEMILVDPETAEQAMDICEALVRSGRFAMIVVDSVAALVPAKIEESSMEQQTMAELARFMSKAMMKLVGPAYQKQTTLFFINQIRQKIGGYAPNGIIPTTTPGGLALKYYSSLRLEVKRGETIKQGNDAIGHQIKVRFIKNKIGMPYKEAEFKLLYGVGIDKSDEIGQLAIFGGIVRSSGAWIYYEDENGNLIEINGVPMKFNGKAKLFEEIANNPELAAQLDARIRGNFDQIEAPEIPLEERNFEK